jgi:hypothetical protein
MIQMAKIKKLGPIEFEQNPPTQEIIAVARLQAQEGIVFAHLNQFLVLRTKILLAVLAHTSGGMSIAEFRSLALSFGVPPENVDVTISAIVQANCAHIQNERIFPNLLGQRYVQARLTPVAQAIAISSDLPFNGNSIFYVKNITTMSCPCRLNCDPSFMRRLYATPEKERLSFVIMQKDSNPCFQRRPKMASGRVRLACVARYLLGLQHGKRRKRPKAVCNRADSFAFVCICMHGLHDAEFAFQAGQRVGT